jgi:hypothetical protein
MKRDILNDENAVSISVGFILTFTITVIAFLMIMQTFYGMLYQAEHTVLREEFEIHGNDIAVQLTNIDTIVNVTLSSGGDIGEIRYDVSLMLLLVQEGTSVRYVMMYLCLIRSREVIIRLISQM